MSIKIKVLCALSIFLFLGTLGFSAPLKYGAILKENGVQFRVYSENAEKVMLCLFERPNEGVPVKNFEMKKSGKGDWSVFIPDISAGTYYGYRAWGPNWTYDESWKPGSEAGFVCDVDAAGNRFNPNKLLIDPYAKTISHDPRGDGRVFASGPDNRIIDSAPKAPKSVVISDEFDWQGDKQITYPINKSVIYEVHVRGFTQNPNSGVNQKLRGTYRGLVEKIPHLKKLNIDAVELLPVQETVNDQNMDENYGDDNYWGYMTLNYMSPDRRYSSDKSFDGPVKEFKYMVRELHKAGIKVILDVVYNHTGEGGIWRVNGKEAPDVANLLSFRGLDNQTYYQLCNDKRYYYDCTGCGGNVRVTHPYTQSFIVDTLRYWIDEMHVDGFRFDLASVLGNKVDQQGYDFDKFHPLLNKIANIRKNIPMVAEPWAAGGSNSYQVGGFPAEWYEWNGLYRDALRESIVMKENTIGRLASALCGSRDLYGDDGRTAGHSINFIAAHDGMTMYDLTRYNHKVNNQAYPYGPSDGGNDSEVSKDWGNEALRQQQVRNFGLLLMLSRGTPMLLGGDEFARTQRGNNNTYNLDTVCNWYDWDLVKTNKHIFEFFSGLIKLRRSHPAFFTDRFPLGKDHGDGDGIPDIQWSGTNYLKPDWGGNSHAIAYRLDGSKEETGDKKDDNDFYVAVNLWNSKMDFQLPPNHQGKKWHRVLDTDNWAVKSTSIANNIHPEGKEAPISDGSWIDLKAGSFEGNETYKYGVNGHSIVVFIEK